MSLPERERERERGRECHSQRERERGREREGENVTHSSNTPWHMALPAPLFSHSLHVWALADQVGTEQIFSHLTNSEYGPVTKHKSEEGPQNKKPKTSLGKLLSLTDCCHKWSPKKIR